jgi:predicted metalloprotease with PDZ domain
MNSFGQTLSLNRFLIIAACVLLASPAMAAIEYYDVEYQLDVRPAQHAIDVEIRLKGAELPSRIVLDIDKQRYRDFKSSDALSIRGNQVEWTPHGPSSQLSYTFLVDHQRKPRGFDSFMTEKWAVFRGEKLVPPVRVTAKRKLRSRASMTAELPTNWSLITAYAAANDKIVRFNDPERRFDRPQGWMLAGEIGTRSEIIAGVQTTVAAPTGDNARRQDTLAFLNWNLPKLLEIFSRFPHRILIVYAGDPMWRGGLSGPDSVFLHSDRPLISENRTSTLLHELVHVALGIHGDEESDWIVEGIAEYYSLEILRRTGSIGKQRYEESLASLARWAQRSPNLFAASSSGATTARAVLVFKDCDDEIRSATQGKASFDDVARQLAQGARETGGEVNLESLQAAAARVAGQPLNALKRERLMNAPRSAAPAP